MWWRRNVEDDGEPFEVKMPAAGGRKLEASVWREFGEAGARPSSQP